jgi:hypothetical protein
MKIEFDYGKRRKGCSSGLDAARRGAPHHQHEESQ